MQRTPSYIMAPSAGESFAGGLCRLVPSVTLEFYMHFICDLEDMRLLSFVVVPYQGGRVLIEFLTTREHG